MAGRSWTQLVAEGRKLIEQEGERKWQWGDLALEVEPMGERGVDAGKVARLEKWADEIGFTVETGFAFGALRQYRHVASRWPKGKRRLDVSFSVHTYLAALDERFEILHSREKWTVADAARAAGRKATSPVVVAPEADPVERVRELVSDPEVARTLMADPEIRHVVDEALPPAERAERASRALRDPEVARHVVQDNRARSNMANAAKEMEEQSEQRQRERAPGLVGMSDFYQATGELSRMRQAGTKSLDAMRRTDLSDEQRESLKDDHERVKLVSEWIDSYLESGDHSFDKELDALLREET